MVGLIGFRSDNYEQNLEIRVRHATTDEKKGQELLNVPTFRKDPRKKTFKLK